MVGRRGFAKDLDSLKNIVLVSSLEPENRHGDSEYDQ